ncbi:MAG: 4Fe-4S dicluster domain-containing protein, partial [Candidatus Korobacteraceae bacterium]
YFVAAMSAAAVADFIASPYGLVVDVRMLNFFRYMGGTSAYVLLGLFVASLLVQNFWCRYLCPYGALLGLASLVSPTRIVRSESACIDCAKCAKACPAALPVDKLMQIRSAECTSCLECVAACPAKDALEVRIGAPAIGRGKRLPSWAVAAAVAIIFIGLVGYAKLSGHWETHLPNQVYFQLVPAASEQQHP